MKIIKQIIVAPIALVYGIVIFIRNLCFDLSIIKSISFNKIIISVGNLNLGGSGKTPHVEYLIKLLKPHYKIATLSRGYGRKTKGFILANESCTAQEIGDEPLQYYYNHPEIKVAVAEKRVLGVKKLIDFHPDTEVFLLDDAYQHRSINRDINLLITDFNNIYVEDFLIPSGTLREWRCGSKRANIIIVSKCPKNLPITKHQEILKKIKPNRHQKVFFTFYNYKKPISFTNCSKFNLTSSTSILSLTGIANPKPFIDYLRDEFQLVNTLIYNDHYPYNQKNIEKIISNFEKLDSNNKAIITTEKDIMRLYLPKLKNLIKNIPIFFIPIEVCFLENGKEEFNNQIINHVKKNK